MFSNRYKNDNTGAPAYDPAILLQIVLFAYSKGATASRMIASLCREHVVFMALSADTMQRESDLCSTDASINAAREKQSECDDDDMAEESR